MHIPCDFDGAIGRVDAADMILPAFAGAGRGAIGARRHVAIAAAARTREPIAPFRDATPGLHAVPGTVPPGPGLPVSAV